MRKYMIIIVKNLPVGINETEFKEYLHREFSNASWILDKLIRTKVVVHYDRTNGEFDFYGLVYFRCCLIAQHVVKRLNGAWLSGREIAAREYFRRSKNGGFAVQGLQPVLANERRRIEGEELLVFYHFEQIELQSVGGAEL